MYQYPLDAPSVPLHGTDVPLPIRHSGIANSAQSVTLNANILYDRPWGEGAQPHNRAHFLGAIGEQEQSLSFYTAHRLQLRARTADSGGYNIDRSASKGFGTLAGVAYQNPARRYLHRWSACAFLDADDEILLEPWVCVVVTNSVLSAHPSKLVADFTAGAGHFGSAQRIHLLPHNITAESTTNTTSRRWVHGEGFFHPYGEPGENDIAIGIGLFVRNVDTNSKTIYRWHGHVSIAAVRGPDPGVRSEPL